MKKASDWRVALIDEVIKIYVMHLDEVRTHDGRENENVDVAYVKRCRCGWCQTVFRVVPISERANWLKRKLG